MFSMGLIELLLLCALALIVLGPEKFPKLAKDFSAFIHQLRSVKEDIQRKTSSIQKSPAVSSEQSSHSKNKNAKS